MNGHPFLQRLSNRLDELVSLCCPGEAKPGILVGFSGGPDSLALLLGAHHWSLQGKGVVEAAHLHHELRPTDADADLDFCRLRCAKLHLRLHELHQDPRPVARRRGRGLEEAARHVRHQRLQEILAASPRLHVLALGHHRGDQAETILMRLFRGTGPDGLRGILPVQGNTLHPMLDFDRREILACLEDLGESWRLDASNLSGDNVRARLRREVIPVLDGVFGPGAHARPLRLAGLLALDRDLLDDLTRKALARCQVQDRPLSLDRTALLGLDPVLAARVLHAWLTAAVGTDPEEGLQVSDNPGHRHITAALAWIQEGQSGAGLDLPGRLRLERVFERIDLVAPTADGPVLRRAENYRIVVQAAPAPEDPVALGRREKNGEAVPGGWRLSCPANALSGNLRVGHPRPGDRIDHLGLEGSKKLSDLLREHGIPWGERPGVLVVRDDMNILWLVGIARSEQTRLLPCTDKIVTITVTLRDPDLKRGN